MELWTNITIEIKNLETTVPTYYLKALMNHIKELVEQELCNAPDEVVDTYDCVTIESKVVKEES